MSAVFTGPADWVDRIYCQSAESMPLPEGSVALAFTSPPYNVGKDYDQDQSLQEYLGLIQRVGGEVYRALQPGGRYVINVANLGRKPYIPLHSYFYQVHMQLGFLPMGEIIWQKGKGANGSCAWGSWKSARSPRLRDIHEYLLVLAKGEFNRRERGELDISDEEFMQATLSVWSIPPEFSPQSGASRAFPAGAGTPRHPPLLIRRRRRPGPLRRLGDYLRRGEMPEARICRIRHLPGVLCAG